MTSEFLEGISQRIAIWPTALLRVLVQMSGPLSLGVGGGKVGIVNERAHILREITASRVVALEPWVIGHTVSAQISTECAVDPCRRRINPPVGWRTTIIVSAERQLS